LWVLDLYRDDLILESSNGQCLTQPLLKPQGPLVLILSGYLKLIGLILGMPSGVFVRKVMVQPIPEHAVIDLRIAHAITPFPRDSETEDPAIL
jgi:hypothetical protein